MLLYSDYSTTTATGTTQHSTPAMRRRVLPRSARSSCRAAGLPWTRSNFATPWLQLLLPPLSWSWSAAAQPHRGPHAHGLCVVPAPPPPIASLSIARGTRVLPSIAILCTTPDRLECPAPRGNWGHKNCSKNCHSCFNSSDNKAVGAAAVACLRRTVSAACCCR